MEYPPINNLIWIDLEMTGLNVNKDHILEIATVITDSDLNIIKKGPEIAVFQEGEVLNNMNSWSMDHHGASGLTDKCRNSNINTAEAEKQTLEFLAMHVNKNSSPMCGNSVHQDRIFLRKYMPKLEEYFHYRNLDVSSFKIAVLLWSDGGVEQPQKQDKHTAMADVLDSIAELKLYKESFLRLN